MLLYFLYAVFFLSCFILVAAVLLQPGKTDAGALFTSNVSSTAFNPRGTATVLSKITIAAAMVFMLSALLISMPALQGNVSVLTGNPDAPAEVGSQATAEPASNPEQQAATENNANGEAPPANAEMPANK